MGKVHPPTLVITIREQSRGLVADEGHCQREGLRSRARVYVNRLGIRNDHSPFRRGTRGNQPFSVDGPRGHSVLPRRSSRQRAFNLIPRLGGALGESSLPSLAGRTTCRRRRSSEVDTLISLCNCCENQILPSTGLGEFPGPTPKGASSTRRPLVRSRPLPAYPSVTHRSSSPQ